MIIFLIQTFVGYSALLIVAFSSVDALHYGGGHSHVSRKQDVSLRSGFLE